MNLAATFFCLGRAALAAGLACLSPLAFCGEPAGQPVSVPQSQEEENGATPSPASPPDALVSTNLVSQPIRPDPLLQTKDYRHQIETARQLRRSEDTAGAGRMLIRVLEEEPPPEFKRSALFELALVAQDERQLARAQQILAQYIQLFPQDATVPEVLLRQGLIFRQMGAQQMAIAKFYAVMNSALSLKLDQFDYYKRVVLQAQTEIADTYYLQGKFTESADFFARILKQNSSDLNRTQSHFKLVRSYVGLERHHDVVTQCEAFFERHPQAAEAPELRFLCAAALKQLGRTREALVHVYKLLQSQEGSARSNPENWLYWQQRAGNDIANQLYLEGDYLSALQIYQHLAELNASAAWQIPVRYQAGLIYERLHQPNKAAEIFGAIAAREKELSETNSNPSLKTVIEMAKWRKEQISWQDRAQTAVESLRLGPAPATPPTRPKTALDFQ